jgi:hypothetical protein
MATREKKPRMTTPIGIACFVHVFTPQEAREGQKNRDPKYKLVLCWDKAAVKSEEMKQLKAACVAAAEAKFGADARDKIKKGKIKMPWRPGTDYEENGFPFDEDGAVFAAFSSKDAPGVVDKRAKPLTKQSEFYSGCFCRVTYGVWAYDTDGNKGVTLFLNNVQKVKDGERLSGRPDAEDDFEAVEGEDGADDGDDLDDI